MTLTIDLPDGQTLPMTPPPELGDGFAAVIATALAWDAGQRDDIQQRLYDATADRSAYDYVTDTIAEALYHAGLTWSCQFGEPDEPAEAGPYIDTLGDNRMWGASYVAAAVLARDLGVVTEADFGVVVGPWLAVGLPLPAPRDGFSFAADGAEVERRASALASSRYEVVGWPLAGVDMVA